MSGHVTLTVRERIMRRIEVQPTTNCWLWMGARDRDGYGRIKVGGRAGTTRTAHRVAYECIVGPVPSGLIVDHLCRNRACVNPQHLEPVTNRENILRGVGPTAIAARTTHCPSGHPYDSTNTLVVVAPSGGEERYCRTCRAERSREYKARQRKEAA